MSTKPPVPWFCDRPLCIHKTGWWISTNNVVACLNCTPPAFLSVVAATGNMSNPPLVLADRTTSLAQDGAGGDGKTPQTPAVGRSEAGTSDRTTPARTTAQRKSAKPEPKLWS